MNQYELIRQMQSAYIEGTKEHGRLCETRDCCTVGMQKALDVVLKNLTLQDIINFAKEETK